MCDLEIEDFDLEPCEYRVIATGYDLEGEEIQGSLVLAVDLDPEEAIRVAKLKLDGFKKLIDSGFTKWGETELSLVVINVETVVKVDGEEQYVGSLFTDGVLVGSGRTE